MTLKSFIQVFQTILQVLLKVMLSLYDMTVTSFHILSQWDGRLIIGLGSIPQDLI